MRRLVPLLLTLLVLSPDAMASDMFTNGPYGFATRSLAPLPGGVTMVSTRERGSWRSNDAGRTWLHLPTLNSVTAWARDGDGTIWAGDDYLDLLRSDDGGTTFQRAAHLPGIWHALRLLVTPQGLVALTCDRIIVWNGRGFARVDQGLPLAPDCSDALNLRLVALPDGELVATRGDGAVLARPAGAAAWGLRGSLPAYVSALVLQPSRPAGLLAAAAGVVHRSTDRGATWTAIGAAGDGVEGLAVDRADAQHLLTQAAGGVRRSDDGGATWRPSVPVGLLGPLVAEPDTGGAVWLETAAGPYRSADWGATWRYAGPAITGPEFLHGAAIDPRDARRILAATSLGVLESRDAGASWASLAGSDAAGWIDHLAFTPAAGGVVGWEFRGISTSRDDGRTWPEATTAPPGDALLEGGPTARDGALWWGFGRQVVRSADGSSWLPVGAPLPDPCLVTACVSDERRAAVSSVSPRPGQPAEMVVAAPGGLYRTTDGGLAWSRSAANSRAFTVPRVARDPTRPNVLYSGVVEREMRLWRSTDGGATWRALAPSHWNDVAVAADGTVIVSLVGGLVLASTDLGETWTPADGRLAPGSSGELLIASDGATARARIRPPRLYVTGRTVVRIRLRGALPVLRLRVPRDGPRRHGRTVDLTLRCDRLRLLRCDGAVRLLVADRAVAARAFHLRRTPRGAFHVRLRLPARLARRLDAGGVARARVVLTAATPWRSARVLSRTVTLR